MSPKENNPLVDLHFHKTKQQISAVAVSTKDVLATPELNRSIAKVSLERFAQPHRDYSIIRQAPRRYGLQETRRQFEHI